MFDIVETSEKRETTLTLRACEADDGENSTEREHAAAEAASTHT